MPLQIPLFYSRHGCLLLVFALLSATLCPHHSLATAPVVTSMVSSATRWPGRRVWRRRCNENPHPYYEYTAPPSCSTAPPL